MSNPFYIASSFEVKKHDECFLNAKRVLLLKEIKKQGSLNAASKTLKMSYQQAWHFVKAMNEMAPLPMVIQKRGGASGGGTEITSFGMKVIQEFDRLAKAYEQHEYQANCTFDFCFF